MKKIAVISLIIAILTLLVPMTLNLDVKPSNEKKENTSASQETDENKELVTIFNSKISLFY